MGARDIVSNLITHDKASKPLKDAGKAAESTARSYDDLSAAEQRLTLNAEKAGVVVDKAARAAARAEERFGKDSEQAREATRRLREAKLNLADAEEKLTDKARAAARATDDSGGRMQRLLGPMRGLTSIAGRATSGLGGFAASVGGLGLSATSVLGPLGLLGARVVLFGAQVGHMALAVAPAAASLPTLAAGFLFAKQTIGIASTGIAKGLDPIMARLGKLSAHLQNVAGRGVPALSRQFLKVNFPTVADAMNRIAKATNGVVLAVGKWVNSLNGQRAIRAITEGTATAVEKLAPHVTKLATAFGDMVANAGPGVFERVSKALGWAADAVGKFIGSISRQDIGKAWGQIDQLAGGLPRVAGAVEGIASKFSGFGHVLLDVGNWMDSNRDQVKKYSDVLAILGLTIGAMTGGVVPILIGSLTLIANHWDDIKGAVAGVVGWFHHSTAATGAVSTAMGIARKAVADLSSWWSDKLMPSIRDAAQNVMPHITSALGTVTTAFKDHRTVIAKAQQILSVLGMVLTKAVIPAVGILAGLVIDSLGTAFAGLVTTLDVVVFPALKGLMIGVTDVFGVIINGGADLLGWVPGVGPELKKAAKAFDHFRADVNKALGDISDQSVNVKVVLTPSGATLPAWYGTSAGMGGHALGGFIRGPGGPRDDAIPARLSNGEFVVNAAATARHRGLLEALNGPGFAFGGFVMGASLSGLGAAQRAELGLAHKMVARMPMYPAGGGGGGGRRPGGLSDAEWYVISRESGGRTTAQNPTSTAFGLGQLLLANRQHYGALLGVSAATTNFGAQLAMFRMYVHDRYGTAGNAAAFWARHHWYGSGGVIREPVMGVGMRSGHTYGFGERGPETVTPGVSRMGSGGTTHTTVQVEFHVRADGSNAALQDQVVTAMRQAVQRGRLSQRVFPGGTMNGAS